MTTASPRRFLAHLYQDGPHNPFPGIKALERRLGHALPYQYGSNEGLDMPHHTLGGALGTALADLSRSYADADAWQLRQQLAERLGVAYENLLVDVNSDIQTLPRPRPSQDFFSSIAWEDAVREMRQDTAQSNRDSLDARLYVLDSPFIHAHRSLADLAIISFGPGRYLLDAVLELNQRIFSEFTYDPESTTVATPLRDVLANRRGVCQDFAHLAIGCLRSLGLAARYVSGYMETMPPEGQQKLVGADATHAWVAVFIPGWGWLEIDPTNGCLPDERYVILGWGRDFADVTPLKGVMTGGGEHTLTVAVDVTPIHDEIAGGLLASV